MREDFITGYRSLRVEKLVTIEKNFSSSIPTGIEDVSAMDGTWVRVFTNKVTHYYCPCTAICKKPLNILSGFQIFVTKYI